MTCSLHLVHCMKKLVGQSGLCWVAMLGYVQQGRTLVQHEIGPYLLPGKDGVLVNEEGRIFVGVGILVAVDPDLQVAQDLVRFDGHELMVGPFVSLQKLAAIDMHHQLAHLVVVFFDLCLLLPWATIGLPG